MIYVLYHSSCYDGFGAAYSAWKLFKNDAKYIPVSYGKAPPELPGAKEIYILDFCFSPADTLKMAETAKVVILDHHKTAEAMMKELDGRANPAAFFDMSKSGALLAWEYFNPNQEVPALIKHLSDRDLWQFKLDGTDKVHSALVSYPMDFELWDRLNVEDLKKEGVTCQRLYGSLVDHICDKAWIGELAGYKVPMVNTSIAWSEVGEKLYTTYPDAPFVASFTLFEDQVMWSLRSNAKGNNFDVSEIAKKWGGGGHRNAAGFKAPRI